MWIEGNNDTCVTAKMTVDYRSVILEGEPSPGQKLRSDSRDLASREEALEARHFWTRMGRAAEGESRLRVEARSTSAEERRKSHLEK